MSSSEPVTGRLSYEIHRRRRRTIAISVRPDGTVDVHAPLRASKASIAEMVAEHEAWIEERRREHSERAARRVRRRFEHGDAVPFLGAELRLVLVDAAPGEPVDVERRGDDLVVPVAPGLDASSRRVAAREAVGRWLLAHAADVFHDCHVAAARRVGEAAQSVVIKEMRSRWGSCGPTRRMSLSWRLVMAPRHVIDYVLVHELTHIRIPDHSGRFWRRVAEACPGWRASRDWLRKHGDDLEL